MPKYTKQIVAFIDILGVKNMLPEFETQALKNSDIASKEYHESPQLNRLLELFRESISLIKESDCSYYLFSDNICITISYINDESERPDLFVEILILISLLTNQFGREGYFIRGGVDVGWFLNYQEIAVGVPLVTAYEMESKKADFPRVLLSENFITLLDKYLKSEKINEDLASLAKFYIKDDDNFSFVNPFFYITQFEEKSSKINFLKEYRNNINSQLIKFKDVKKVKRKYEWLASEFDSFLTHYFSNSAYKEFENPDTSFSTEEIQEILKLKIQKPWLLNIFHAFGLGNKK